MLKYKETASAVRRSLRSVLILLKSPRGKDLGVFAMFLVISAILWFVLALNENMQRDLRCPVKLVNVPDSLTRVSPLPEAINVSVKTRVAAMLGYAWNGAPQIPIDYRTYHSRQSIVLSGAQLRGYLRNVLGQTTEIVSISPDTINVRFTSSPGVLMPVHLECEVETAPQFTLTGKPRLSVDTVRLYSADFIPANVRSLKTKTVYLDNLSATTTVRAAVMTPPGTRAIPDSVDVTFTVEPLISKQISVPVTTINVPSNERLIVMPSQIDVHYMVPMSVYKKHDSEPGFRIEANYRDIRPSAERLPVHLVKAPAYVINAFINADSAMYLIEKLD